MKELIAKLIKFKQIKLIARIIAADSVTDSIDKDFNSLYKELKNADKKNEYTVKKQPTGKHPRLEGISQAQKKTIRNMLKKAAFDGRVFHDKKKYCNAYSVMSVLEPKELFKIAKKIEKDLPVKVYTMPYVQWSGTRPMSYFRLRTTYIDE